MSKINEYADGSVTAGTKVVGFEADGTMKKYTASDLAGVGVLPTGSSGDILYHNGTTWVSLAKGVIGKALVMGASFPAWIDGFLLNVVEDVTPQLGGNLDLNSKTVGDASAADLTKLSQITSTKDELNILDGVTADKDEINILDGATLSTAELNYVDGVTSDIQTQLNAKSTEAKVETLTNKTLDADGTGNSISNIEDANIKAAAAIDASKIADGSVSDAEYQRLDGVTADIQGQIDSKADLDATILSKSANYELVAGDAGKIIECNGSFTITLPDGVDEGFQCTIVNIGSGTVIIAASTTLQTKDSDTLLESQYTAASAYHRGSNVWIAFGDLTSP